MPRCSTHIHPDVEPIGPVLEADHLPYNANGLEQLALLVLSRIKPGLHVPARDQQGVTVRDRVLIPKSDDKIARVEDAFRRWMAEDAGSIHDSLVKDGLDLTPYNCQAH